MERLALMLYTLACLSLGAVAANAQDASGSDQSPYERGYRASFRSASIRECVAGVRVPVPAGIDVPAICGCSTDWLLEHKTLAELKQPMTEEDHGAIQAACFKFKP